MATAGFISIAAGVQLDKFSADLNKMRSELSAMVPKVQGIGGNVGTAFVGGFAGGLAAQLTTVVSKAVGAVGGAVSASIFNAGDFEGSISKARLLFGKEADAIVANAEALSKEFGTVRSEAIDAATGLANSFQSMGADRKIAAALGVELTNLGNDLARVTSTRPDEAFTALSAAIRGEFDPLERFGIALKASQVEAAALTMGLARTKSEVTELDKRFAAMSLIRDQGAQFEGAAAKLSGGLNAQLEQARGRVTRLSEEIGQALTPVLADFLETANVGLKLVLPYIEGAATRFKDWMASIQAGSGITTQFLRYLATGLGLGLDSVNAMRGGFGLLHAGVVDFASGAISRLIPLVRVLDDITATITGIDMGRADALGKLGEGFAGFAAETRAESQALIDQFGKNAKAFGSMFDGIKKPAADAAKAIEKVKIPIDDLKKKAAGPILGGGGGLLATINAVTSAVDAAKMAADVVSMNPPKLAGAVEAGSTDARSAILQAQIGTPRDQQQRALANNTQQTARNTAETNKLLAKQAMMGLGVFTF